MTKGELFKRLHKVDDINTALLCVQMQIDRLEGCLQGHAIRYDQDKVQTSPKDAVAEVMCDLEGLLKKQTKLRIAMTRAVADVADLIDRVDDRKQSLVLHYRYVACLPWRTIADKMGYAESHLFKIHDAAIKKILQVDSK
jgi:DNA-directed RNA polymerase specialized sigma subunit